MIRTDPAFTDSVGDVLQLIPGVPYELLPAGTQPTDVTSPRIFVKAMLQAIPQAKVQTVTCHARRVTTGFPGTENIIKKCCQGFPQRHIHNIAEFKVFSNEKITRINIPGSFSRARLRTCGVWGYWDKDGIFPGKSSTCTEDCSLRMSVLQAKKTVSKKLPTYSLPCRGAEVYMVELDFEMKNKEGAQKLSHEGTKPQKL